MVVDRYREREDIDNAALECAGELRAVLAEVLYRGRLEARRASHQALSEEIAVARALGAGPIPAAVPAQAHEKDRARANAAAQAYANAWLAHVREAHAAGL
jgi:hypothetical protein